MNRRLQLQLLSVAALTAIAAPAFADECATDADCGEGFYCGCDGTTSVDPDDGSPGTPTPACTLVCLEEWTPPESECETDADCPFAYACEEIGGMACADSPPCAEGEECPEPPECDETTWSACVPTPIPCSTDADCGGDLACVSFTYDACSGGGVEPMPGEDSSGSSSGSGSSGSSGSGGADAGSDGGSSGAGDDEPGGEVPIPEDDCETVTESFCAPRWIGNCTEAADCGAGFDCVELEECACSGSAGGSTDPVPLPVPPEGSGSSDPSRGEGDAPDDECECFATGEFYCEPQEITCEADSDCPDTWTCEVTGATTSPCYEDRESGEWICEDVPSETTSACVPAGWYDWGGGGGSSRDLAAESGAPTASPQDDDNTAGGSAGGSENIEDPIAADGGARPQSESGCSSAPSSSTGAFAALALLGLSLVRRRR
ncbi:MAG: hypothetical protein H6698_08150 [Myxococcales bacterium]|nr:hypothetical protein [Myxococcales bacterium]MCB9534260.1 hypothetical protein [Myxococcales bacterium]